MHYETSPFRPLGTRCSCGINRDHTIHEFYELMDEPHPSAAHLFPEYRKPRKTQ